MRYIEIDVWFLMPSQPWRIYKGKTHIRAKASATSRVMYWAECELCVTLTFRCATVLLQRTAHVFWSTERGCLHTDADRRCWTIPHRSSHQGLITATGTRPIFVMLTNEYIMWLHMRRPGLLVTFGKTDNRTDKYENSRKQFRKQNLIISNRFDFIVIGQIWFKQEIKQGLHLYMGIVPNCKMGVQAWPICVCMQLAQTYWSGLWVGVTWCWTEREDLSRDCRV